MKYFETKKRGKGFLNPMKSVEVLSEVFNSDNIIGYNFISCLGDESGLYQIKYNNGSCRYVRVYFEEITGYGEYTISISVIDKVFDSPVELEEEYGLEDECIEALDNLGLKYNYDFEMFESKSEEYNFMWVEVDWLTAIGINEVIKRLFKMEDAFDECL